MQWLKNLEQAKEESVKTHKLILLQFEKEGCEGCKKLNSETYPDPKVQEELTVWFVLLKLDLIKDREIRRSLGGYWTPAIYFLDHNGNSYYHFNGFLPPKEFRAMLRLGISETIMPRGKYDDIISVIDKDLEYFSDSPLYQKLLLQREIARYIKTKNNSLLRNTRKEIRQKYPDSLEARMYFWDD